MEIAGENERCKPVSTKAVLVMLVLAGSGLAALKGRWTKNMNGVQLSDRVVSLNGPHKMEHVDVGKTEACVEKLSKNGFGLNVGKRVEVIAVKDNGSLEKMALDAGQEGIVSRLAKVRNTIVMDQDDDVDTPKVVVTMEDGTRLIVDLNTCTALRVFVMRYPRGEDLKQARGVQVEGDGWRLDRVCIKDNQYNGERVMRNIWDKVVMYSEGGMTPEKCGQKCGGYKYFGLEYWRQCFCGTKLRYDLRVSLAECYCKCSNLERSCGCANRMVVYKDSNYRSKCLKFPRHYSKYGNGHDSIGFFQEGCSISANIWRWNGATHVLTKAYVGHFVHDWNQLFITLSNGEGQWQGFAKESASGDIGLISWVTGSWTGRTFQAYT